MGKDKRIRQAKQGSTANADESRVTRVRGFTADDGAALGIAFWYRPDGYPHCPEITPIVLVHGFAQSAATWDETVAQLGRDHPVVTLELMGHGETRRLDAMENYGLSAQADVLGDFLAHFKTYAADSCRYVSGVRALDAEVERWRKPLVVGYSLGGRLVLEAMRRGSDFADNVSGVVLESAGLGPANATERAVAATKDAIHARMLRTIPLSAFFDYWESLPLFESQRALPAEVRKRVREERLANDSEALARTFEEAGQHRMASRTDYIKRIRALVKAGLPVAYVTGEKDAKYCGVANKFDGIQGLNVHIVPNAGHNVHLEQPENFAALISELARS